MKHLHTSKLNAFLLAMAYFAALGSAPYLLSMFVWPWVAGKGSWGYVQDVWDRWQALNVGVLAFLSSLIAFSISRSRAEKQRERDFLAAKAFLPAALSELCAYFKDSAKFYELAWEAKTDTTENLPIPELPVGYKSIFQECIRHAEPLVGDYLSKILVWLQVHDSRMKSHVQQVQDKRYLTPNRGSLIPHLYRLAELQAMVNKLFPFARNMKQFESQPLDWEDFRNAYGNLDIWFEEKEVDEKINLEAFTKRQIASGSNNNDPG